MLCHSDISENGIFFFIIILNHSSSPHFSSAYGQLKSLRLPKKFTGGHRGFAFLDFTTKQEARNVYDNMASIHLYGRHLVLEWAEEDGGVEALREKTSRQFAREESLAGRSGKRRRVDLDGKDEEMDGMDGEDEEDD